MILINEWLPNPVGSDVTGEWIELWNSGSAPINLAGYGLITKGGSKFTFGNVSIGGGGYLVLPRTTSKLTLKNSDEALTLYDARGVAIDHSGFVTTAQEGRSFSRFGAAFSFAEPTPGSPNKNSFSSELINDPHPVGEIIGTMKHPPFFLVGFGVALALALVIVFIIKRHEDLQNIFFSRNNDIGPGGGESDFGEEYEG